MRRTRRRRCRYCRKLFQPDPRNRYPQRYCSQPGCRQASKAASQQRWLKKNPDYYRGPLQVARVQAWRAAHPGYARRLQRVRALQDHCVAQPTEDETETSFLTAPALQDLLTAQSAVLIGLIANLTGSPLPEDIAKTGHRLRQLGHDILEGARHAQQNPPVPRARTPDPGAVQLGRSAPGPPAVF